MNSDPDLKPLYTFCKVFLVIWCVLFVAMMIAAFTSGHPHHHC